MPKQKRPTLIEDIIYSTIIDDCMNVSKKKGMGLAQSIAKNISIELLTEQQRELYDTIGKAIAKFPDGMSTSDVARHSKMNVNTVSSQLVYMYKRTRLLICTYEGRFRVWKQA